MDVVANGNRLWFDVDGPALVPDGAEMRERPSVVLLHGGPGSFDHSYYKPDFARLADVAQVVYLDLLGHGRSEWGDPLSWSFEVCADSVRDFCDTVGIRRPVVYGHSLGGFVAMVYAVRHPVTPERSYCSPQPRGSTRTASSRTSAASAVTRSLRSPSASTPAIAQP